MAPKKKLLKKQACDTDGGLEHRLTLPDDESLAVDEPRREDEVNDAPAPESIVFSTLKSRCKESL